MDAGLQNFLSLMNVIFTIFFAGEMLLKWVGIGLGGYFRDTLNVIDFFVVVIGACRR